MLDEDWRLLIHDGAVGSDCLDAVKEAGLFTLEFRLEMLEPQELDYLATLKDSNGRPRTESIMDDARSCHLFTSPEMLARARECVEVWGDALPLGADAVYTKHTKPTTCLLPLGSRSCRYNLENHEPSASFRMWGFAWCTTETGNVVLALYAALRYVLIKLNMVERINVASLNSDSHGCYGVLRKVFFPGADVIQCVIHIKRNAQDMKGCNQDQKAALTTQINQLQRCAQLSQWRALLDYFMGWWAHSAAREQGWAEDSCDHVATWMRETLSDKPFHTEVSTQVFGIMPDSNVQEGMMKLIRQKLPTTPVSHPQFMQGTLPRMVRDLEGQMDSSVHSHSTVLTATTLGMLRDLRASQNDGMVVCQIIDDNHHVMPHMHLIRNEREDDGHVGLNDWDVTAVDPEAAQLYVATYKGSAFPEYFNDPGYFINPEDVESFEKCLHVVKAIAGHCVVRPLKDSERRKLPSGMAQWIDKHDSLVCSCKLWRRRLQCGHVYFVLGKKPEEMVRSAGLSSSTRAPRRPREVGPNSYRKKARPLENNPQMTSPVKVTKSKSKSKLKPTPKLPVREAEDKQHFWDEMTRHAARARREPSGACNCVSAASCVDELRRCAEDWSQKIGGSVQEDFRQSLVEFIIATRDKQANHELHPAKLCAGGNDAKDVPFFLQIHQPRFGTAQDVYTARSQEHFALLRMHSDDLVVKDSRFASLLYRHLRESVDPDYMYDAEMMEHMCDRMFDHWRRDAAGDIAPRAFSKCIMPCNYLLGFEQFGIRGWGIDTRIGAGDRPDDDPPSAASIAKKLLDPAVRLGQRWEHFMSAESLLFPYHVPGGVGHWMLIEVSRINNTPRVRAYDSLADGERCRKAIWHVLKILETVRELVRDEKKCFSKLVPAGGTFTTAFKEQVVMTKTLKGFKLKKGIWGIDMQPIQAPGDLSCGVYTLLHTGLRLHNIEVTSTTYKAYPGAVHLRTLFANALVRDCRSGFEFERWGNTHEPYIWKEAGQGDAEKRDGGDLLKELDRRMLQATEADKETLSKQALDLRRHNPEVGFLLLTDYLSLIPPAWGTVTYTDMSGNKQPASYYGWLTDNVINFCFDWMHDNAVEEWKKFEDGTAAPRDHYLRTYFGKKFNYNDRWREDDTEAQIQALMYGSRKRDGSLRDAGNNTLNMYGYDVKHCDRIVLPLNTNNGPTQGAQTGHWYLCVIDKRDKTIVTYCSLSSREYDVEWLKKCAGYFFPGMESAQWRYEAENVKFQQNGYDCGVFTIANALIVSSPRYERNRYERGMYAWQDDMASVRLWIASRLLEDAGEDGISGHVHRRYRGDC